VLETLNRWDWGSPRAWNDNYSAHRMMKQTKGQARQHLGHKHYYMAKEYKEKSVGAATAQE